MCKKSVSLKRITKRVISLGLAVLLSASTISADIYAAGIDPNPGIEDALGEGHDEQHIHSYDADGYCECGEYSSEYVHVHEYVDGVCACGYSEEDDETSGAELAEDEDIESETSESEASETEEDSLDEEAELELIQDSDDSVAQLAGMGDAIASGTFGSATYEITENDDVLPDSTEKGLTLTLTGEGALPDCYRYGAEAPEWFDIGITERITRIDVSEGITALGARNCGMDGNDSYFYLTNLKKVTLPSTLISIGEMAFYQDKSLEEVNLPDGLESIGSYAFYNCPKLQSVVIPDSVTSLGESVFMVSGVTSVKLPAGISRIPESCFYGAKLENFEIPSTITTIGKRAFGASKLQSITIPSSVTTIEAEPFFKCESLTTVTLPENMHSIPNGLFYGCISLDTINVSSELESIGSQAFAQCRLANFEIPGTVKTIGNNAFVGAAWTQVTIPDSVETIGSKAFYASMLTSVSVSSGVKSIGMEAFAECPDLKTVTLQEGLESISDNAFYGTGVRRLYIPESVTEIGGYILPRDSVIVGIPGSYAEDYASNYDGYYTFKSALELDSGTCGSPRASDVTWELGFVSSTDRSAYKLVISGTGAMASYTASSHAPWYEYRESIKKVVVKSGVTTIGEYAFDGMSNLAAVDFANTVKSIPTSAFANCGDQFTHEVESGKAGTRATWKLTRNDDYLSSGADAFTLVLEGTGATYDYSESDIAPWCDTDYLRNITRVEVGEGITVIGAYSFYGMSALTQVNLPSTLNEIGSHTFASTGITNIDFPESLAVIGEWAFDRTKLSAVTLPLGLTRIGDNAFVNCTSLRTVQLSRDLEVIGNRAFSGCTLLESDIVIPDGVTSIGEWAFYNCKKIKTLVLPLAPLVIGKNAFYNCTGLSTIDWGSVSEIGYQAFYGCTGLTEVIIPGGVTLGNATFEGCYNITSATLGEGITGTGENLFLNCIKLSSVELPSTLKLIGFRAFSGCTGLTSIDIPDTVTSIGSEAFKLCTGITEYTIPQAVNNIGINAFPAGSEIRGYIYSAAHTYADNNALSFEAIDVKDYGTCEAVDSGAPVSWTLYYYSDSIKDKYILSLDIRNTARGTVGSVPNYSKANPAPWHEYAADIKEIRIEGAYGATKYVASVGDYAFDGCTNVELFVCDITTLSDRVWGDSTGITPSIAAGKCGDNLRYVISEDGFINVPGSLQVDNGYKLTVTGTGDMYDYTYSSCPWGGYLPYIKEIELPEGMTSIGDYAFYYSYYGGTNELCSLTADIDIPDSVISIGRAAFYYAYSEYPGYQYAIRFGSGSKLKKIGDSAFGHVSRICVVLPDSVEVIEEEAFQAASLSTDSYLFPTGLRVIGDRAYENMNYKGNISLSSDIIDIGEGAFNNARFEGEIIIPHNDEYTEIKPYTFAGLNYLDQAIVIPSNITKIGEYAFSGMGIEVTGDKVGNFNVPGTVTEIGYNAFGGRSGYSNTLYPIYGETGSAAYHYAIADAESIDATVSYSGDTYKTQKYTHRFVSTDSLHTVTFLTKEGGDTVFTTRLVPDGDMLIAPKATPMSDQPRYVFAYWKLPGETGQFDFKNEVITSDITLVPAYKEGHYLFLKDEDGNVIYAEDGLTIHVGETSKTYTPYLFYEGAEYKLSDIASYHHLDVSAKDGEVNWRIKDTLDGFQNQTEQYEDILEFTFQTYMEFGSYDLKFVAHDKSDKQLYLYLYARSTDWRWDDAFPAEISIPVTILDAEGVYPDVIEKPTVLTLEMLNNGTDVEFWNNIRTQLWFERSEVGFMMDEGAYKKLHQMELDSIYQTGEDWVFKYIEDFYSERPGAEGWSSDYMFYHGTITSSLPWEAENLPYETVPSYIVYKGQRYYRGSVAFDTSAYGFEYSEHSRREREVEEYVSNLTGPGGALDASKYHSDAARIRAAYDWVVNNVKYESGYNSSKDSLYYFAYAGFFEGKGSCECMAQCFNYICRKLGVNVRILFDDYGHVYNMVQLGGNWYYVDCSAKRCLQGYGSAGHYKTNSYILPDWSYDYRVFKRDYLDKIPAGNYVQKTYTLTLNPQGGSVLGKPDNARVEAIGGEVTTLDIPTRIGYIFDGWYTAAVGGDCVATSESRDVEVYNNQTLYAHWSPNKYTVSLKLEAPGAAWAPDAVSDDVVTYSLEDDKLATYQATYSAPYIPAGYQLPVPVRTGYDFAGWSTDAEGDSIISITTLVEFSKDATDESEPFVLYDQWTPHVCKVTFDCKGGEWDENILDVTEYEFSNDGIALLDVAYEDDSDVWKTMPVPVRRGYSFAGWCYAVGEVERDVATSDGYWINTAYADEPGDLWTEGGQWKCLRDITFVAKWTPNKHIVTFNIPKGSEGTPLSGATICTLEVLDQYSVDEVLTDRTTIVDGDVILTLDGIEIDNTNGYDWATILDADGWEADWMLSGSDDWYDTATPVSEDIVLDAYWYQTTSVATPVISSDAAYIETIEGVDVLFIPENGVVTITADSGAQIFYEITAGTTPGTPDRYSRPYTGPVVIDIDALPDGVALVDGRAQITISAIAVKDHRIDSPISSETYMYISEKNMGDIVTTGGCNDLTAEGYNLGDKFPTSQIWAHILTPEEYKAELDPVPGTEVSLVAAGDSANIPSYVYSGTAIKPEVRVYYGNKRLVAGTDYTITYRNNVNVSDPEAVESKQPYVTIKGRGKYSGKCTKYFQIDGVSISAEGTPVSVSNNTVVAYNGRVQQPSFTVTHNGKKLVQGRDYVINSDASCKEAGAYACTIEGIGNYTGSVERTFIITNAIPLSRVTVSSIKAKDYNGSPIALNVDPETKEVTELNVKYNFKSYKVAVSEDAARDYNATAEESDKYKLYLISNTPHTDAGTVSVVIKALNENLDATSADEIEFYGEKIVTYRINPVSISGASITGVSDSYPYTGREIKPAISVKKSGRDVSSSYYTVTYKNNVNAGTATITVKGKGNYTGSVKKTFRIERINLADAQSNGDIQYLDADGNVTPTIPDQVYTVGGSVPVVTPIVDGRELQAGVDYYMYCYNNKTAGATATAVIVGIGNYKDTYTVDYNIAAAPISGLTATAADVVYRNRQGAYKSALAIYDTNGKLLVEGRDYTIDRYVYVDRAQLSATKIAKPGTVVGAKDIVPVGISGTTIRVEASGMGNYTGTISCTYRVVKASMSSATVSVTAQNYKGIPVVPKKADITVKIGRTTLKASEYEIISVTNNTKTGYATMVIRGTGVYGGTRSIRFRIK